MSDSTSLNITVRSGGQTGVDRAALDAALAAGVRVTGWCPQGRLAEDGRISARYPLVEVPSPDPADRTRRNVRDADATLILSRGRLMGGTALTAEEARRIGQPVLVIEVDSGSPEAVWEWLRGHRVRDLNVAGPRESEAPGIYAAARAFLLAVLAPPVASGA